jgi:hypothetical protein
LNKSVKVEKDLNEQEILNMVEFVYKTGIVDEYIGPVISIEKKVLIEKKELITIVKKYNSGFISEVYFLNHKNEPTEDKNGIAKIIWTIDDENILITSKYFDINDELTENSYGIAEKVFQFPEEEEEEILIRLNYDREGIFLKILCYDEEGDPLHCDSSFNNECEIH